MTASYPLVTDERFPGEGVLTCGLCRRPMPVGTPYSECPDGMVGDVPCGLVVCVYCGPAGGVL